MPQKLKKLKEFLKKHCEAAVRSHLDTVVGKLALYSSAESAGKAAAP
jgi:hypothetical protein